MPISISQKLERYLIRVIDDPESTRKEKADAARQLTQLKLVKPMPKPKPVKAGNTLGTAPAA